VMRLATLVAVLLTVSLSASQSTTPVADAAMRGDAAAVQALIKSGADVKAGQGDGMTALHWTALNGDAATSGLLLTAGAPVDAVTRLGNYTPLHLASSRGHAAVVARLLESGSTATAVTDTGVQPLHLAAQAGSVEAVTLLLARGADINVQDRTHGRSPLVFAASQNRLDVMKVLITRGADINRPTTVIDYVERARLDAAERTERNRAMTAATGRAVAEIPPVDTADRPQATAGARTGGAAPGGRAGGGRAGGGARGPSDTEIIGKQGGMTALHYAARDGYAGVVELLLESGMHVNTPTAGDKSSPLLVAIVNGQYDIAATLLERGADPNHMNDDLMAPMFAVINNEWALRTWYPQPTAGHQQKTSYLTLLKQLAAAGADPNARVKSHVWHAAYNAGRMGVEFTGATAFWRAAYALDVEAMQLLVSLGADPHVPTMTFGSAVRANDQSGVPAVPTGGAHIPPFHAASGVGYGTSRVAQQHRYVHDGWMPAAKYFLEELGVDVNIRDADGFTALHHAAARGDNDMIRYLVKKGANVMAVNRAGQTTEQRTQPFPDTIKLLEGMGAKNNNNCQACK
jgi:ankyrin repeat protein